MGRSQFIVCLAATECWGPGPNVKINSSTLRRNEFRVASIVRMMQLILVPGHEVSFIASCINKYDYCLVYKKYEEAEGERAPVNTKTLFTHRIGVPAMIARLSSLADFFSFRGGTCKQPKMIII
jgi:hypothetical protein